MAAYSRRAAGEGAGSPISWSTGNRKWTVYHTECSLSKGDRKAHPHSDILPPSRPHLFKQSHSPNSATPFEGHFLSDHYSFGGGTSKIGWPCWSLLWWGAKFIWYQGIYFRWEQAITLPIGNERLTKGCGFSYVLTHDSPGTTITLWLTCSHWPGNFSSTRSLPH